MGVLRGSPFQASPRLEASSQESLRWLGIEAFVLGAEACEARNVLAEHAVFLCPPESPIPALDSCKGFGLDERRNQAINACRYLASALSTLPFGENFSSLHLSRLSQDE
jgi:hypothetical protein